MNEITNNSDVILSIRGLKKSFGKLEVLKGIDLDITDGEKIAIIGPSGCGKSTFLRCLNCMEDPTGGSIFFDGVDIADMSVDINVHRENIGMVFQQFNLFNNKTVIENIMLAPVYVRNKRLRKTKKLSFKARSEAKKAINILGGKIQEDILFDLVENMPRRIIRIKKISQTPTKYPRPSAQISKKPLK